MIGSALWTVWDWRDRFLDWWSRLAAPWQAGILAIPTWSLVGVLVALNWFGGGSGASAALALAVPAPVAGTTSTFRADGEAMVLYARGPDGSWREVRRLDQERVPGQFAKLAATSPDRRLVAYVQADDQLLTNATVSVVEVATGEEHALVTIPRGLFPATPVWAPDGSRLAIVRRGGDEGLELWTVGVAGGDLTRVPTDAAIPPAAFYGSNQTPLVWSEDSDRLIYTVPAAQKGEAVRTEVEVATGRVRLAEPVSTGPRSPCEVPVFSQNDPRWSGQQMFTLGDTIGTAGCALTATAMLLNYYGNDRTPAELNACLGAAAEPIYWASAADRDCDAGTAAFESYEPFSWERLAALMAQARPVILGFAGGITGSHYVVVTSGYGSDGGNYSIVDPWDGSTWKTVDYYAAKGYAPSWLVVYRGKAPECTDRQLAPPVQVPDPATAATATGVEDTWRWRNLIEQVAVQTGVDADVLQAVMALSSGGNPNAVGPSVGEDGRAMGLMQVLSRADEDAWRRAAPDLGRLPSEAEMLDPTLNVRAGAIKLAGLHARGGRWADWLVAGVGYFGAATAEGQLTGATDAYGTDGWTYYDRLRANVEAIRARLGRVGVVPPPPIDSRRPSTWASTGTIDAIFGGAPYSISQNFGPTDFSPGPGAYDYSAAYGLRAGDHAGTDLAVPYGTPLYAPTTAKVVFAGPWQYFAPNNVQLQFADGTIAIFGHMSAVAVTVGATVAPGQPLGASGTAGTGPHLHLEVRVPDPTTSSGQRAVDPMVFFGTGGFAGAGGFGGPGFNWPTADAINARIATSEQSNPGQVSPLRGRGEAFLRFGTQYGINPGAVTAVLQRESQLGADGSILPTQANNFGGITGSGNCGSIWVRDRYFARFCTPEDGLAANFAIFNLSIYRQSDGTMGRIMEIYAPPWDGNDHAAMWRTFTTVATQLGITLTPSTNIYSGYTGPAYAGGAPPPAPPPLAPGQPPVVPTRSAGPPPTAAPLPTLLPTAPATPGAGAGSPVATTETPTATATSTVTTPGAGTPTGPTPSATPAPGGTPAIAVSTSAIAVGSPVIDVGPAGTIQLTPHLATATPGTPAAGPTATASATSAPGPAGPTAAADASPGSVSPPTPTTEGTAEGTGTSEPEETVMPTPGAIPADLLPDIRIFGPEDWTAYDGPVTFDGVQVIFPADRDAVVSSSVLPGTTFAQDGRYTITTTVISPQVPGGSRQFTTTFFVDTSAPATQIQVQGVRYQGPAGDLAREIAALPSDLGVAAFAQSDTVASLAGPIVYNRQAILTLVAADALTPITAVVYRVDGGKWRYYTNSGQPHSLSFEQHGCNTVDVYAVDAAGNLEPMQQTSVCVFAKEDEPIDLPTPTPVFTPTPTETPAPTPAPTSALLLPTTTPTATPSATPTATAAGAPTNAPPPDAPPTPTASPTPTPTTVPGASPASMPPSLLPTTTPTPEPTTTPDLSPTRTATARPTRTATPTLVPATATQPPPPPTPVIVQENTPPPTFTPAIVTVTPTPSPTAPPAVGTVRITTFGIGDEPLPGACYRVTTADGLVMEPVCDRSDGQDDGQTTIPSVLAGTVMIAQSATPAGYVPAATKTGIDVPPDAAVEIAFENQPLPGRLWIETVDEAGAPIAGACYVVTASTGEAIGPVCDGGNLDADPSERIRLNRVPAGPGRVRQTEAPPIYEIAPETTALVPANGEAQVRVVNTLKRGDVNITKVDPQGRLLPGACFTLTTPLGGSYGVCDNDGGWDGNPEPGKIDLRAVEAGAGPATLVEDSAPAGYAPVAEQIPVEILPNQPNPVQVVNVGASEIVIVKYDAYTKAPLAGVEFALLQGEVEVVPRAATGADGTVGFRVPPGRYAVRELAPPAGYVEPDGDFSLAVEAGGPWYVDIPNYRELITLVVQARGPDGTTPLEGACYELADGGFGVLGRPISACDDPYDDLAGAVAFVVYPAPYTLTETETPGDYVPAGSVPIDLSTETSSTVYYTVSHEENNPGAIHLEIYGEDDVLLEQYDYCFEVTNTATDLTYGPYCTSTGTLDFFELPPGEYTTHQTSDPPHGIQPIPDQSVTVNPGETANVRLVAVYDSFIVGVLVEGSDGTPIAGASLSAGQFESVYATAQTDAKGRASFRLLVRDFDYNYMGYAFVSVDSVPSGWLLPNPSSQQPTGAAGSVQNMTFTAEPAPGTLEIRATTTGGQPIVGWQYAVTQTGADFDRSGATGDGGVGYVYELEPGAEYCVAHDDDSQPQWIDNTSSAPCATVAAGETATVAFTAEPAPGNVHVQVNGSGASLAGWSFAVTSTAGSWDVVTDATGHAVVPGVPSGYQYCATPGPPPAGWQSITPPSACADVPAAGDGTIVFTATAVPTAGTLVLVVNNPEGWNESLDGVDFYVRPSGASSPQWSATSDVNGQATIPDLPPGTYCVVDTGTGRPGVGVYPENESDCRDVTAGGTTYFNWYYYSTITMVPPGIAHHLHVSPLPHPSAAVPRARPETRDGVLPGGGRVRELRRSRGGAGVRGRFAGSMPLPGRSISP